MLSIIIFCFIELTFFYGFIVDTPSANESGAHEESSVISSTALTNVTDAQEYLLSSQPSTSSMNEPGVSEESSESFSSVSEWSASNEVSDKVVARREVNQLRDWAIESNIQQIHLDKLLSILRQKNVTRTPKVIENVFKNF